MPLEPKARPKGYHGTGLDLAAFLRALQEVRDTYSYEDRKRRERKTALQKKQIINLVVVARNDSPSGERTMTNIITAWLMTVRTIVAKFFRVRCDKSTARVWPKKAWAIFFHIGRGAGYIHGATAYITWRSGSARWANQFRGEALPFLYPLQIGLTRNGNKVPYLSH